MTATGTGVYCFKAHGQIYHWLDQLVPVGEGIAICSYTFMTLMTPWHIGSKGHLSLILQCPVDFESSAGQPICASIQESRLGV
jgi:hypothetical protein